MAFIRTEKRAVLTRKEIEILNNARAILRIIDGEDNDGEYFCKIEDSSGCGCEWDYLANMLEALVNDCEQLD